MHGRARVATLVVAVATLAPATMAGAAPATEAGGEPPPNVVVVMTDDQTLDDLEVMTQTRELIGDQGTTFSTSYVSYPLCCPSRSTFLTGQYSHNHGVEWNQWPTGGFWKLDSTNTLPVWLQEAGYHTTHIGKYLNGYGSTNPQDPTVGGASYVPPGWSDWQGLVDPGTYRMYGYTINDNQTLVRYGSEPDDYQTDVIADRAVTAIDERAEAGTPFFVSVAPLAPHAESATARPGPTAGPRAAPRHEGVFADLPFDAPPSFDEADVSDKPSFVQDRPRLTPAAEDAVVERWRDRREALLAVDDLVGSVVGALEEHDLLEETVIVFTSDNGFFHGEHRIPQSKYLAYEESVHVPLLVRGPGFPAGHVADQLVANVDLAPTIVEATGATPRRVMDGRSLRPLANDPSLGEGRSILLETGPNSAGAPVYDAIHTGDFVYVEYTDGQRELYDLRKDPYQLRSRDDSPRYVLQRLLLDLGLEQLDDCTGTSCLLGT